LSKETDLHRQQLAQLRQENAELREQLAHQQRVCEEQQATLAQLQSHVESLSEQNTLLKKALFGQRRERYVPSPDQKLLFEPESLDHEDQASGEDEATSGVSEEESNRPTRRRKKRKRFEFPQCLPTKRVEYPLPPEELACPCGCGARVVISEDVTKQLEYIPPSAYVLEHVRFTYACPRCRDGQRMVTTEKPANINEKGVFGPSVLAYLGQAKYVQHLPLYRLQEELESATTMWFNRSVLSGALNRTAWQLRPLRDVIHARLLRSFYLHADETTARVLRPGTGKTAQTYLWIYVGDEDHPYRLFDYHLHRSRAGPQAILGDYQGGLLTDGHSAYTALIRESEERLIDLGCWAHGRRGFDESCAVTSHPLAHEALAWIGQLYDLEDQLADAPPEERLRVRQQSAVPILDRLYDRMTETLPTLRPSSKLAEAIGYVLNRWPAMKRYTTDGRYRIDNNEAERSLRPSVIGRKNYLFFGSDDGGHAAAIWYTITQSARQNHVNVQPYLLDVLKRLPQIVPEYLTIGNATTPFESLTADQREAIEAFLPDRWLKEHPEHRMEERMRELDAATTRRRNRRANRRLALKA
jgi:transposase